MFGKKKTKHEKRKKEDEARFKKKDKEWQQRVLLDLSQVCVDCPETLLDKKLFSSRIKETKYDTMERDDAT